MPDSDPKTGQNALKPVKFLIALAFLFAVFLFPEPASDLSAVLVSNQAIPAETPAVLEPGTLLLFGTGIMALGFQWMSRR